MTTPCIECFARTPGCHATCEEYARWRKSYDKMMEIQKKDYCSLAVGMLADYSKKTRAEYQRRNKGRK